MQATPAGTRDWINDYRLQRLTIIIKKSHFSIVKASNKKIPDISALGTVLKMNPPGLEKLNQALLADAEEHGASLALRTRIRGGQVYDTGLMDVRETGKPFWM